jgi:hypothetical protein
MQRGNKVGSVTQPTIPNVWSHIGPTRRRVITLVASGKDENPKETAPPPVNDARAALRDNAMSEERMVVTVAKASVTNERVERRMWSYQR